MVPRLRSTLGSPADPPTGDADAARYFWFDAVRGVLQAAGREQPVLLILDDLQWADGPSLHLLRHVIGAGEPSRLMVVGTPGPSRSGPTPPWPTCWATPAGWATRNGSA
jgi:hypothetical protein